MATNATIVVSFSDDADSSSFYMAQVDNGEGGDHFDKTSFPSTQDSVSVIVQHSDSLQILRTVVTHGSFNYSGEVPRTFESEMTFAAVGDTGNLPCIGSVSLLPIFGRLQPEYSGDTGVKAVEGGSYPAIVTARVSGTFKKYLLYPQPIPAIAEGDDFEITIFIYFGAA